MKIEVEIKPLDQIKKCYKCNNEFPATFFYFYKSKTNLDGLQGKCRTCENTYQRLRAQTWYADKRKIICKNYKLKLRQEVLSAYGHKCACCGESTDEFLELDHINGGGYQHRKKETKDMYSVVRKEGFPKDKYRLLCANCNHSLGMKGYCPHQKNKTNEDRNRSEATILHAV